MRLAILQGMLSSASGGLAASVPAMVHALLSTTQVEPHVLGVLDPSAPAAAASWGRSAHPHRAYGPPGFHWAPEMARSLAALQPDLIDTQGVWMNLSRIALAHHRRRGTPLVVTPHGMLDPWAVRHSAWRKQLVRWWFEDQHLASAGAIRALNVDEALAVRRFGAHGRVAIIPNGIVPPQANLVADAAERQPVFQFLGGLDPKKGLEPLFQAWALVVKDPSARDWSLRVNGWGDPGYVQRLHRFVVDLDLAHTLNFGGPLYGTEKDTALRASAGFILPSFSEGLPMAVLEAWAWGTPVLMTRACNLPVGFTTGAALEISTDPRKMAARLLDYIAMTPQERNAMSAAGRRLVDETFHAHTMATNLERLFGWLVGTAGMPVDLMFTE